MRAACLMTLLLPGVAYADWPAGSEIDPSVSVDVTEKGFNALADGVGAFIPPRIDVPVDPLSDSDDGFLCIGQYSYDITISNAYAEVDIQSLTITPGSGGGQSAVLSLAASASVNVNSSADPLVLDADYELFCIGGNETCDVWVDPVTLDIWADIELSIIEDPVTGERILDANIPTPTWGWNLDEDDITLTNCFIGDLNDVLDLVGLNLLGIVIDEIEPTIDEVITDLPAELEPALVDAFAALTITETIDLLGTPLTFSLYPSSIRSQPEGLRIELGSTIDAPPDPCVEQFGIDASLETPAPLPAISEAPSTIPFDPHIAAHIDDDFVNHLLWSAWYSGLLCLQVDDDSADLDLPLPIDTNLLGLLAPGVYDDLFPETEPMSIITVPRLPPEVVADGANDVNIVAEDLGLDFAVDLDGRRTRLLGLDLDADIGVDLPFDPATGELAVEIGLDAGAITPTAAYNEFKPEASADIEASFSGLFDTLVGPLLGGSLEGLVFPLPSFAGLGITELQAEAAGSNGDMVGAFVTMGPVPYGDPYATGCDESGGCDTEGGCDSSGCDSGCATGGLPGRVVLLLFPMVAAMLRRRQR